MEMIYRLKLARANRKEARDILAAYRRRLPRRGKSRGAPSHRQPTKKHRRAMRPEANAVISDVVSGPPKFAHLLP